ncbi:MAG TPA: hypothetical protein VE981_24800 [Planctomycetota bacterium]|nr:hypothetical protein [Planctomycetota bacterium]
MTVLVGLLMAALLPVQDEMVAAGNVVVRLPAGWKAEQKPDGLFLSPGDLKEDQSYVVIIAPGGKATGNLAEGLEKSWKEFEGSGKVSNRAPGREMKTEGGTEGLLSVGILDTKDGSRLLVSIALFKPADRFEAVMALSPRDGVFQKYSADFGALLKSLRFRNVELPAYELVASSKGDALSVAVLFKDGTALSRLPEEGLDLFDPASAKKRFEGSWGTHETKDGEVRIVFGDKTVALKPGGDAVWLKVAPSTGLPLEGKYSTAGKPGEIVFKADGSFEDGGGLARLYTAEEAGLKLPKSGTYEIANNTLRLKFAGFTPKVVSFVILATEPGTDRVFLQGMPFQRAR